MISRPTHKNSSILLPVFLEDLHLASIFTVYRFVYDPRWKTSGDNRKKKLHEEPDSLCLLPRVVITDFSKDGGLEARSSWTKPTRFPRRRWEDQSARERAAFLQMEVGQEKRHDNRHHVPRVLRNDEERERRAASSPTSNRSGRVMEYLSVNHTVCLFNKLRLHSWLEQQKSVGSTVRRSWVQIPVMPELAEVMGVKLAVLSAWEGHTSSPLSIKHLGHL